MVHPFPPGSLFFEHDQADNEVHLQSYWIGPSGSVPEVKRPGCETDEWLQPGAENKAGVTMPVVACT